MIQTSNIPEGVCLSYAVTREETYVEGDADGLKQQSVMGKYRTHEVWYNEEARRTHVKAIEPTGLLKQVLELIEQPFVGTMGYYI